MMNVFELAAIATIITVPLMLLTPLRGVLGLSVRKLWTFASKGERIGAALDVSVVEQSTSPLRGTYESFRNLRYQSDVQSGRIRIHPDLGYLTLLESGGPLGPIKLPGIPFAWGWPTLDIKV